MPKQTNQVKKNSRPYFVEPEFNKFLKGSQIPAGLYEIVHYKKGETFNFRRLGQNGFYYIADGLLKLEIASPAPRILRLCRPGDLAGFGNWMADLSVRYQLVALTDCEVQFWTKDGFERLQKQFPEISELIIRHLIQVIMHKDERLASLENNSVETRVIHLLIWLAKNYGTKLDDGMLIDVELDRPSMAQLAGTIPVTLSRVLTLLEDDKLLRRRRRQLVVLDLTELQKRANSKGSGR